jgi:hypothetical protein
MRTTATHNVHYNATAPVVFLAFQLSEKSWKLGFTLGHGQKRVLESDGTRNRCKPAITFAEPLLSAKKGRLW